MELTSWPSEVWSMEHGRIFTDAYKLRTSESRVVSAPTRSTSNKQVSFAKRSMAMMSTYFLYLSVSLYNDCCLRVRIGKKPPILAIKGICPFHSWHPSSNTKPSSKSTVAMSSRSLGLEKCGEAGTLQTVPTRPAFCWLHSKNLHRISPSCRSSTSLPFQPFKYIKKNLWPRLSKRQVSGAVSAHSTGQIEAILPNPKFGFKASHSCQRQAKTPNMRWNPIGSVQSVDSFPIVPFKPLSNFTSIVASVKTVK